MNDAFEGLKFDARLTAAKLPRVAVGQTEAACSTPPQSSQVRLARTAGLFRTEPAHPKAGNGTSSAELAHRKDGTSSAAIRALLRDGSGACLGASRRQKRPGSGLKALEQQIQDELLCFKSEAAGASDAPAWSSKTPSGVVPALAWMDVNPVAPSKAMRRGASKVSFDMGQDGKEELPERRSGMTPRVTFDLPENMEPGETQANQALGETHHSEYPGAHQALRETHEAVADSARADPAPGERPPSREAPCDTGQRGRNNMEPRVPSEISQAPNDVVQPSPSPQRARDPWTFRGSLDQVHRRLQQGIVARTLSPDVDAVWPVLKDRPARLQRWLEGTAQVSNYISTCCLHISGILPWSANYFWLSRLYQVAVLLFHILLLVLFIVPLAMTFEDGTMDYDLLTPMLTYSFVALGNVAALVGLQIFRGSPEAARCLENLAIFSAAHDTMEGVDIGSGWDYMVTFAAWLCYVGTKLHILFQDPSQMEIMVFLASVLSSGEFLILTLLILRFARHMTASIDSFCSDFLQQSDYRGSVLDWSVVQALVRTSSAAIQGCFVALQSTLVLATLVLVCDVVLKHRLFEWNTACAVVLVCAGVHISFRAAQITEACTRVPQLINSSSLTEDEMDPERRYLVEYIEASSAGFYVFNVRLSSSTATRVVHHTLLLGVTIARLFT